MATPAAPEAGVAAQPDTVAAVDRPAGAGGTRLLAWPPSEVWLDAQEFWLIAAPAVTVVIGAGRAGFAQWAALLAVLWLVGAAGITLVGYAVRRALRRP